MLLRRMQEMKKTKVSVYSQHSVAAEAHKCSSDPPFTASMSLVFGIVYQRRHLAVANRKRSASYERQDAIQASANTYYFYAMLNLVVIFNVT